MKTASPKKLSDGSWGGLIKADTRIEVEVNDEVLMVTSNCKSWIASVTEIVESGRGYMVIRTGRVEASRPTDCPAGHGTMAFVKDMGKGLKKYACDCGHWVIVKGGQVKHSGNANETEEE
jgi:hypothetical protein